MTTDNDDDGGDSTAETVFEGSIKMDKLKPVTKTTTCTITIIEQSPEEGGNLQILGNLPEGSEGTIGGELAYNLLQVARVMMNHAADTNEQYEHTRVQ